MDCKKQIMKIIEEKSMVNFSELLYDDSMKNFLEGHTMNLVHPEKTNVYFYVDIPIKIGQSVLELMNENKIQLKSVSIFDYCLSGDVSIPNMRVYDGKTKRDSWIPTTIVPVVN